MCTNGIHLFIAKWSGLDGHLSFPLYTLSRASRRGFVTQYDSVVAFQTLLASKTPYQCFGCYLYIGYARRTSPTPSLLEPLIKALRVPYWGIRYLDVLEFVLANGGDGVCI
jgi:hypothetical protein